MDEIAFADLPEDMQCLVEQLVLDADEDAVIPAMLPLGTVPLAGLPDLPLDDLERGEAYALDMDPDLVPPVLIAEGHFLDGRHRSFAARARGVERIAAIDLSGIVPPAAARGHSMGRVLGWERGVAYAPALPGF